MMGGKFLCVLLALIFLFGFRDVPLDDKVLEERAMRLFDRLSCPVCEGQSLGGSSAELASDIRNILRKRIKEGYSDEEVTTYLEARYGEGTKLTPDFGFETLLLWLGPILFFVMALWVSYSRRS